MAPKRKHLQQLQWGAIAVGNNGSFAIFAAVTQTAVTECEVEKEQEEQEEEQEKSVRQSEGAQCTKQQQQLK